MPNGWSKVYLKELLSTQIKNGYSPNSVEQKTGYVVLGLGALTDQAIDVTHIKNIEPTEAVLKTQLSYGDFLISRSNTPDKVGRSVMFRGEIENCSYPDLMMRFRVTGSSVEPTFLEIYLQASNARQYLKNRAAGSSSSMVKITKAVVEKIPVLLPPPSEQRKIAKIISTWDNSISITERLLSTSQQQKKALMQQLLTGRKRLVNPETGKVFEGKWECMPLSKVCKINKGKQINRSTLNATSLYPVINGGVTPSGYTSTYNTQGDTITISEGGNSCGYVDYQKSDFWCGGHCYNLSEVITDIVYLYQYLKYSEPEIMSLRVGSGLPNIQKKAIDSIIISFPSKLEQQKIAEVLTAADKEIDLLKGKLSHLKEERKALMQQLLTGKRRVTIDDTVAA